MNQLELAIEVALRAHAGQQDKSGGPYILHPLHLMMQMDREEAQITAVLHDVVEDSSVTLADLAELGFSPAVLTAVDLLTHKKGQPYADYIQELKHNDLARQVKLADLTHNMDMERLPSPLTDRDHERIAEYLRAWETLTTA